MRPLPVKSVGLRLFDFCYGLLFELFGGQVAPNSLPLRWRELLPELCEACVPVQLVLTLRPGAALLGALSLLLSGEEELLHRWAELTLEVVVLHVDSLLKQMGHYLSQSQPAPVFEHVSCG